MSKNVDLTGMRFGKLTVLEPTKERKNGYTVWICRCDCGNTVHAASRFLKNGWMTSCGCEGKKPRYKDLTGKRFGKLQVLSISPMPTAVYSGTVSAIAGTKLLRPPASW